MLANFLEGGTAMIDAETNAARKRDLPGLLDILTSAVTTLDAYGVDGYSDLYLYVSGHRGDEVVTELAVEKNRFWMSEAGLGGTVPRYIRADEEGNRRSLLVAELCYAMFHWHLGSDDIAGYLGCGTYLLDRWIADARSGNGSAVLSVAIANDIRRLVIVESERIILGIPDGMAADWVRQPRSAFGGRSIADLLLNDGEIGFRRIQMFLLNGIAAAYPTVH
jgi:hypothetical protein